MGRIDYVGGLLSIVSVGSLVYATIEGPHFGWGAGPVTAAVVAAVGLVAFVVWELRHPHPMLDVRKFAGRPFSGSMRAVLFFFFGTFGSIYYSTQFLRFVLGYDALETGVRLLPLAGMAIGSAGVFLLTRIETGSTYTDFLPSLLLGFAIGLSVSPATDTIMGSFPESELGVGGGANDTAPDGGGIAVAERIATNPAGGPRQAQALMDAVHEAFAHSVAQTSLIGGIIMAVGTVIVLVVLPGRRAFGESHVGEPARTEQPKELADAR